MLNAEESPFVFLVDDNPEFAYLIDRYCESCGCQVRHFLTTREALAQLEQNPPKAILFNMMLPSDDSQELIQTVRNNKNFKPVPVVMFSSIQDETRARSEGADYFLWKPIMYADFLLALQATGVLHSTAQNAK